MSPTSEAESTFVVAVDTGGTFTDLLLLEEGRLRTLKVPSTPRDPAEAVLGGVDHMTEGRQKRVNLLLHGSTVGTNAILEGRGARVALITNRGFEDVIEIGRQNRPQLYALVGHRPPPLVERDLRFGIRGRLGAAGEEVDPLDEQELEDLARRLSNDGSVESVAVVLLHSYAEPRHEARVEQVLLGHLKVPLSVSSRLLPEYREYERTSTTVVNAYIAPRMSRYLETLERETGEVPVRVMGSNGGTMPVERAAREPVHTVLSGPAGGVVGARAWAERAGRERIMTFDMGGTSSDVSLCPGGLLHTREFGIAGHPVAIPVLDIHTVGAGGGSLARLDAGGALRVGPGSAGAEPGPICYGHGGEGVTVTDAHVWLGRLPPDGFLGGQRTLDREAIRPHLERLAAGGPASEATSEDIRLARTAEGILSVADATMERALRVISVERGYDPADFALVAFGGAGGLHAAELADRLGTGEAFVPPDPGLLSAYGMLAAPVSREASTTVLLSTDRDDWTEAVDESFREMEEEAVAGLISEGRERGEISLVRQVDARYRGQSFELRVSARRWVEAFHRAHEERYGYARRDAVVEAVTLRVLATAPGPALPRDPLRSAVGDPPVSPTRLFREDRWIDGFRVWRGELGAGHRIEGPGVILEYSGTTWVPPDWLVNVDASGCLHLTRRS